MSVAARDRGDAPRLIAHRGASWHAPENTIAATRTALRQGADGIELDVRVTACGTPVICHDESPERTTIGSGRESLSVRTRAVRSSNLEELQRLDAGAWFDSRFANERIPTLEQALAKIPANRDLFLEWKGPPDGIETLVELLLRARRERLRVLAFDLDSLRAITTLDPERRIRAHWLLRTEDRPAIDDLRDAACNFRFCGIGLGVTEKLDDPVGLGPDSASWIRAILDLRLEIAAWTVDESTTARTLIHQGVTTITTNRVDVLSAELT
ncbi:MAG: glycerophosphodiester phosphodiesterase family protein [Planctomycetota bacterium]